MKKAAFIGFIFWGGGADCHGRGAPSQRQRVLHGVRGLLFRGGIGGKLVGATQEVVGAGGIEIRQAEEDIRGDVALAHFIIGIADLGALQVGSQVLLKQVPILPQVTDASILGFVPPFWDVTKSIDKTKCFIDI